MKDFYSTVGGRRLCDSTLPELVRQLKRVADEMKRANNIKERELKSVHGLSLADEAKAFMEGHEKDQTEEADLEGDASLHALDV